jgi:alpha-L-arabinofuranosidase
MKDIERREFLKLTTLAAAGIGVTQGYGKSFSGKSDLTSGKELFVFQPTDDLRKASLVIDRRVRSEVAIHPHLMGKFCEQLGANIYHGMDAQILFNHTFGKWRFFANDHPDGGVSEQSDRKEIYKYKNDNWPDTTRVLDSFYNGCAWGWFHFGNKTDDVRMSPDVSAAGVRAQRVEMLNASPASPSGIAQWIYLPIHRIRNYSYRILVRAMKPCKLQLQISPYPGNSAVVNETISVETKWDSYTGKFVMPEGSNPDDVYAFSIVSSEPAHVVIARVTILPDDHINGADPDVIRMLRDSHLPLLRWPGGNFVSGYHWQDAVGPVDNRPTLHNPAWQGIEPNSFGTNEYLAFCSAVGCDPLICVNAGSGTAEEAAAWVEYCNGSENTKYGAMRAANGHPKPYGVKLWEIGNELFGRWQISWTTPEGYADRFVRFAEAMHKADPTIEILATGAQGKQDCEWTKSLLATHSPYLKCKTDHILSWSPVGPNDDPWDIFQAYMSHAVEAGKQYRWLQKEMMASGIAKPQVALTEMAVYPHWYNSEGFLGQMTSDQLINPVTIAEAVHYSTFLCESVRLNGFIRLITHTALVNHGGGLAKQRERVWAHPVYYSHLMASAFAGATPVGAQLSCGTFSTKREYGVIPKMEKVSVIDTVSAVGKSGELIILVVGRARESVSLDLQIKDLPKEMNAEVMSLTSANPWDGNNIAPQTSSAKVMAGSLKFEIPPCSVTRIIIR